MFPLVALEALLCNYECVYFAQRSAESLPIGHFIGQEFEGDKATEFDALGSVDHTHPPPPTFSTMRWCETVWPIIGLKS
jgi:hypothetical protein